MFHPHSNSVCLGGKRFKASKVGPVHSCPSFRGNEEHHPLVCRTLRRDYYRRTPFMTSLVTEWLALAPHQLKNIQAIGIILNHLARNFEVQQASVHATVNRCVSRTDITGQSPRHPTPLVDIIGQLVGHPEGFVTNELHS